MRWIFFALPLLLFGNHADVPIINATFEGEPSAVLEGCVHAISGRFFLAKPDLVTSGVEPIRLYRLYTGLDTETTSDGWEFCPHLYLKETQTFEGKKVESIELLVREPTGGKLYLVPTVEKKFDQFQLNLKKHLPGMTNTGRGEISGRTNLKNLCATYNSQHGVYTVRLGDGTQRIYCKAKERKKHQTKSKRHFILYREELPSGNKIHYKYDEFLRPTRIWSTNPKGDKTYAWVEMDYEGNPQEKPNFNVRASDNQKLRYLYKKVRNVGERKWEFTLEKVKHPYDKAEKIVYSNDEKGAKIFRHHSPTKRTLNPSYYEEEENRVGDVNIFIRPKKIDPKKPEIRRVDARVGRVSTLKANTGPAGCASTIFTLFYHLEHYNYEKQKMTSGGQTHIQDSVGRTTRYRFDKHLREEEIKRDYQGKTIFKENFNWGFGSHEGNLTTKTLYQEDKPFVQRFYRYDAQHNVISERVRGEITGSAKNIRMASGTLIGDEALIRYVYNHRNLVEETRLPNGLRIELGYLEKSNQLTRKLYRYDDRILKREFYRYNEDNILVEKIIDNGDSMDPEDLSAVTKRLITRYTLSDNPLALNMPATEEHFYFDGSDEVSLNKREFAYNPEGLITYIDQYDAQGELRYSLLYSYDEAGRILYQTDALGQVTRRLYDKYGNLSRHEKPGGLLTDYQYDSGNRCISKFDRAAKKRLPTHYVYDTQSRLIKESDHFGHWTEYSYDGFDNINSVKKPEIPDLEGQLITQEIKKNYNIQAEPTLEIDALGNQTQTEYNIFRKPIWRRYPDGTTENFFYNIDGTLAEHIDVEGRHFIYAHDPFGRLLNKKLYDESGNFIEEESFTYDAFNCLTYTDVHGITTSYTYDGAGRKIKESRLDLTTHFLYDELGRLEKNITTSPGLPDRIKITHHDLLNRVIEEREEDSEGKIYSYVSYGYDANGNRTRVTHHIDGQESITLSIYDHLNRLIKTIDPKNRQTLIFYDETHKNEHGQTVLKKTTVDPKGRQLIEIFDTHGRVVEACKQTEFGELLQKEESVYDLAGNRLLQKSTVIRGKHQEERLTGWTYDWKGRVTSIREAIGTPKERLTKMTYTPSGLRSKLIKPDGVEIATAYDAKGRPLAIVSSDGTIHYEYEYGSYDPPLVIHDLIHKTTTTRLLDERGLIVQETLANGLSLASEYNGYSQVTAQILPDNSTITYEHTPYHLHRIERQGAFTYAHTYNALDHCANPLLETTLDGSQLEHTYNLIGHETRRFSPFFEESYTDTDLSDNLISSTLTLNHETTHSQYSYDTLDRLIFEKGAVQATYTYDSHNNRLGKNGRSYTLTILNELLSTQERHFRYDPNGNPVSKTDANGCTTFRYDAYNRLVEAQTPTIHLSFLYDAMDRLLVKVATPVDKPPQTQLFLYDGRKEIGIIENDTLKELRILGLGRKGDIGSAVAIELDGKPYIPIHSITGNFLALIDPDTQAIAMHNQYSAFGELTSHQGLDCSWGYQSKRFDKDLELYFFGFRAYDPHSGRFTTPDPLGFQDLPNLYPFALNNPHLYFDRYGLFNEALILQPYLQSRKTDGPLPLEPDEHGFPRCASYSYETSPGDLRSGNFSLQRPEHPNGKIFYTFINGICTTLEDAHSHADHFSKITGGYNVHYTYNATHGLNRDILEARLGLMGHATEPAYQLKESWEKLFAAMPDDGIIRHICHSQGAIHTYNALALMDEEFRNRIEVLAVAPAKSIPHVLAKDIDHIVSDGFDFVYKLQTLFPKRDNFAQPQIRFVPKHPSADFFDHSFQSLSFHDDISDFLMNSM